jgi:hypothetical protein
MPTPKVAASTKERLPGILMLFLVVPTIYIASETAYEIINLERGFIRIQQKRRPLFAPDLLWTDECVTQDRLRGAKIRLLKK